MDALASTSSLLLATTLPVEPLSLDRHPPRSLSRHTHSPPGTLPSLPTELHKEVLRFCDPLTLAKTSLVSLAFLEMSTPFLYYEVEVRGCEQLSLLFTPRTLPSLLPSSTGSSLPPIHILRFIQVSGDFLFAGRHDLLLSIPTQPALRLHQLVLRLSVESLTLRTLYRLCHPKHLVVQAPLGEITKSIDLNDAFWSRLQTIHLVGPACVGGRKLRGLPNINFPRLRLVTYDLSNMSQAEGTRQMGLIVVDLPLPEPVEVVVFVKGKWERRMFRAILKSRVEGGLLPASVTRRIKVRSYRIR